MSTDRRSSRKPKSRLSPSELIEEAERQAKSRNWALALDSLSRSITPEMSEPELRDALALAREIAATTYYQTRKRARQMVTRLESQDVQRTIGRTPRLEMLQSLGLSTKQAEAIGSLRAGPYDVWLQGLGKARDESALHAALGELGYMTAEARLLLERVEHIGPEAIAFRLHQSEAVTIKVRFEGSGAKVRIRQDKH